MFELISSPDFITGLLSLFFTVMILSYVVGDNPAFRLAIHVFIGISAGYITSIVLVQIIGAKMVLPLFSGDMLERALVIIPGILGLILLAKISPRTEWIGRPIVAFLVGIGAAAAVAGAMMGTLYPQVMASISQFDLKTDPDALTKIGMGGIVLLGTVTTLAYFQFTVLGKSASSGKRGWFIRTIAFLGQIFIAITLGALFAGAFSAALTAFVDRIHSIVLFFDAFFH